MKVVGTAGHVDHGKSTLVKALTGINPDRLKEEQKREMTIDLGFAWLTLPNNEQVGIVDVPGHRDFIENMLAGVGGIHAVIFVIGADEGIMPQTREHLAILNILQIKAGVVALTKCDLVDHEWLEMIQEDVRQFLAGTTLEKAPIIPVSSKNGAGLEQLKVELSSILATIPQRKINGHPRLPIDRVFTISGFGTVVTGTLLDGSLKVGSEIEILPSGVRGRIRGLQSYKQKEDTIQAGSRCAVNISGVDVGQIQRGDVVVEPGQYETTQRFDADIEMLSDASGPLHHGDEVKLFTGTSETIARIRLIGKDEIKPGDQGWVQLETVDPVLVVRGDRFVLRRPSPGETLGGGSVDEPHSVKRYKRFDENVLQKFKSLQGGSLVELVLQNLDSFGLVTINEIVMKIGSSVDQTKEIIRKLIENGSVLNLSKDTQKDQTDALIASQKYWVERQSKLLDLLSAFHRSNPLKKGLSKEEIKNKLKLDPREFNNLIDDNLRNHKIVQFGSLISSAEHKIEFTPEQKKKVDLLLQEFDQSPLSPLSVKDAIASVGEDIFNVLNNTGDLIQVSDDVVFSRKGFGQLKEKLIDYLNQKGQITVAEFRDLVGTSRKFAMSFLEYCDQTGLTMRDGDYRKLKKNDG
jgi:selenocysteine-specific elongation factor